MGRPKQETKFGPVGTFDPALFRKMIQALGLSFRWSRALECPCRLTNTDQYDPTCSRCGGDGWWYVNPDARTDRHQKDRDYLDVQATFAMSTAKPSLYEPFGGFDYGEAQMTVQAACRVSYRDRFVGTEMEMGWTELLIRDADPIVRVGKTGRTSEEQRRAMRYEPVRINYIADEDDVRYWEDSHWRLREGTSSEPVRLEWLSGPAVGKRYTVHYAARPIFIVDDAVYSIQGLVGPEEGLKGTAAARVLPTTFKVKLDFLTPSRGA